MDNMIDWTDDRVVPSICRICQRLTPIARGSQLDKEQLCSRCSYKTDNMIEDAVQRGLHS